MAQTLYEILEVRRDASADDVRDAYRRMAMKWHPDRNPERREEAERKFKEISNAYRLLSDPQRRMEYDIWLTNEEREASRTGAFGSAADRGRQEEPSGDESRQMFFEQMLELAFELARRGFEESAIAAALSGLGCPDAIARAAASTARRRDGASAPTPEKIASDVRQLTWEQARSYYNACVAGSFADRVLTENRIKGLRRTRYAVVGWSVLVFALGGAAIGLLLPQTHFSVNWVVGALVGALAGLLAGVLLLLFLPSQKAYFAHTAQHYYLKAFEPLHAGDATGYVRWNFGAFCGGVFWLAWKRMLLVGIGVLLAVTILPEAIVALADYAPSESQTKMIDRGITFGLMFVFGFLGTGFYYRTIRS